MTYEEFERWFERLSPKDKAYLKGHPDWKGRYEKAKKSGMMPEDFPGFTMEILEGGSDSET
ncbi:MAG TPA: hypothetical protein VMU88_00235 [bacterium]|nr:hypothetical protein [bacterium]